MYTLSVKNLGLRSTTSLKNPISTLNINLHVKQNAKKEVHDSNHLDYVHTFLKSSALSE